MNINQILYKISNLRYNIRKKEVQYNTAVKAHDQDNMNLTNTDLAILKEDLVVTVTAFNSIPVQGFNNRFKSSLAKLFQFGTAYNKKQ